MIQPPEVRAAKATIRAHNKATRKSRPKPVRPTAKGQRAPRLHDRPFLAFVRLQPCSVAHLGGCAGKIESAHIRYSNAASGFVNPGMGAKSSDRRCVALCRRHHREGPKSQHAAGERRWWADAGRDPDAIAAELGAAFEKRRAPA